MKSKPISLSLTHQWVLGLRKANDVGFCVFEMFWVGLGLEMGLKLGLEWVWNWVRFGFGIGLGLDLELGFVVPH